MNNRIDELVLCPFYVKCTDDSVVCEGVENDMKCRNTFAHQSSSDRERARIKFMEKYCCNNYNDCVLNKALETKYE